MPVSLFLAVMNGCLRTGNEFAPIDKLTECFNFPDSIDLHGKITCFIIKGQALVVLFGKPNGCFSFRDPADTFVQAML